MRFSTLFLDDGFTELRNNDCGGLTYCRYYILGNIKCGLQCSLATRQAQIVQEFPRTFPLTKVHDVQTLQGLPNLHEYLSSGLWDRLFIFDKRPIVYFPSSICQMTASAPFHATKESECNLLAFSRAFSNIMASSTFVSGNFSSRPLKAMPEVLSTKAGYREIPSFQTPVLFPCRWWRLGKRLFSDQ